jgi:hypothetical protein
MKQPTEGPLHERWGPYVRNIQPVEGTDLFIAEATRGTKGKGRIWWPVLIRRHPEAGQPVHQGSNSINPDWQTVGAVKPATGYRAGLYKACLYNRKDANQTAWCYMEAFLPEPEAVPFLIHAAKEFFK